MSDFGIIPYSDRVVFKKIDLEQKTKGGIIIVEQEHAQEVQYGEVVAVGRGKIVDGTLEAIPMETEVGDTIAYKPNSLTPIKYEGEQYFMLRESDILSKIK